ncbi:MAG: chemotaxis protein CheB [candidate division NC10 bacterium]|nr:chemotaxis protein CheB [candidate division NC10 bacterium]
MAYELIVIGVSLGGLTAVKKVLEALPKGFPAAVAVVQHRRLDADEMLVNLLQDLTAMPVVEPEDKDPIRPGYVYLAPSDYHLLVEKGHFALSTDAPVWHARPSIDALFESAADAYRERVVGVILTGNSQDGAQGLAVIKRKGGLTMVQDPHTAEAAAMPKAAIAATAVDKVLPLEAIGPCLAEVGGTQ